MRVNTFALGFRYFLPFSIILHYLLPPDTGCYGFCQYEMDVVRSVEGTELNLGPICPVKVTYLYRIVIFTTNIVQKRSISIKGFLMQTMTFVGL